MIGKTQGNGIADLERVFTEYRDMLERAEKESEEIVGRARAEAAAITEQARAEAQRLAAVTERQARSEVEARLKQANDQADRITGEAESKARKEAKQKVRQEIEKIITSERALAEKEAAETVARAQQQAAEIVAEQREAAKLQSRTEALDIVARAREKARKIDEDSILRAHETDKLLTEVVNQCQGIVAALKQQSANEFDRLGNVVLKARENLKDMILANEVASTKGVDADISQSKVRLFKGLQEIRVLRPYRRPQIDELIRTLCQFPRVRLSWESGNADYIALNVEIGEPLPLFNMIQDLPQVMECEAGENVIEVKLKAATPAF